MNIYFELSDCFTDEGKYHKYWVSNSVGEYSAKRRVFMMNSDRAWAEEDDGTIRFIKHRFADMPFVQVDLNEFLWVKLSAVPL